MLNLTTQTNVSSNISTENNQINSAATAASSMSSPSKQITRSNQSNAKEDYLNQRLIVKENNTLQFLADRITEQESYKKSLFDKVYSSRNNAGNKIAAANAITILNKARIVFSGMDLSEIDISEADLSYAIMHKTNLSGTNLQGVSLRQSYMCEANLNRAIMKEVDFGQLPMIQLKYPFISAGFLKDTHVLAVVDRENIFIWDIQKHQEIGHLKNFKPINQIAFSPDGCFLALAEGRSNKKIIFLNLTTQKVLSNSIKLLEKNCEINCICFSPNGKYLACIINNENVWIWDVKTQRELGKPLKGQSSIKSISFSSDGNYLAGSGDEKVFLWDIDNQYGVCKSLDVNKNETINILSFSPDGKYLVGGSSAKSVLFWDVDTHQLIGTLLDGHADGVTSICFSPDGKYLASGSRDATVCLWSLETRKLLGTPMIGHQNTITSIAFSPNGMYLISGGHDRNVRIWILETQNPIFYSYEVMHKSSVTNLSFDQDGKYLVSGSKDKTTRFWDFKTHQQLDRLQEGHTGEISSICFSPDGQYLASGGKDGTVQFWDSKTHQKIYEPLTLIGFPISSMAWCGERGLLFLASAGTQSRRGGLSVWDVITYLELSKYTSAKDRMHYRDNDVMPYRKIGDLFEYNLNCIAISSDKKFLAIGGDEVAELWELNTDVFTSSLENSIDKFVIDKHRLLDRKQYINSVTFSLDGKILAAGGGNDDDRIFLALWNMENKQLIGKPLVGHIQQINCLAFYPAGQWLLSGSKDCTLRIWSVQNQECIRIYNTLYAINSINLSANGDYLAVGTGNGAIEWWYIQNRLLLDYILIGCNGNPSLAADELNFNEVKGISKENSLLLTQIGANKSIFFKAPVTTKIKNDKRENDESQLNDNTTEKCRIM